MHKALLAVLIIPAILTAIPGRETEATKPRTVEPTRLLAFPGAAGAGAYTAGGRGGEVYRVTNLNVSGPGSLADAVSKPQRLIVFEVSGIIDLSDGVPGKRGKIVIEQPHLTIAGQTAPGEGICLKNGVLDIKASDVIVRHIRSRRGFIAEGDSGDSVNVKPEMKKASGPKAGTDPEQQKKIEEKKKERGKDVKVPAANLEYILLDHVSASWSTDENLTVTHANWTTAQFCLIAEGLDYANPKQTPPRHSEGSLWGVSAPDGRSTFHHNLYAHNRLRNPRTTGGEAPFAVLEFRNNVVYNASENFSHTGAGAVYLNWIDNYYKAGPSTPAALKGSLFEFVHSKDSRMYARGNVIEGYPEVERDNWKGVRYGKGLTEKDAALLRVEKPFPAPAMPRQSAEDAYRQVLDDAGATLPARDAVDLRIVQDVHSGTGRIIDKETDLPPAQRWPTYYALPAPKDSDGDGIPDYWEEQFDLNRNDPTDSKAIGRGGYANIEHYFNNTDPTGGNRPLVYISGAVGRARGGITGQLKVTRTSNTEQPLEVHYRVGGSAVAGKDYEKLSGVAIIPAGSASVLIPVKPMASVTDVEKLVVVTLESGPEKYNVGCPCAALVAVRK